jgi:predicted O-methyltransferase YrrM
MTSRRGVPAVPRGENAQVVEVRPRPVPAAVTAALREASRSGFAHSCSEAVGRLLAAVAAAKPGGRLAESGTGTGAGAAWLLSGMDPAARLLTVEHDAGRAAVASAVLAADPRVRVLKGDWRLLEAHAPFDVFFCDGGGKRDDPGAVVRMLAPGGVLMLDDFTPPGPREPAWPPSYRGAVDTLRLRYLTDPALVAVDLQLDGGSGVVLATRR